MNGIIAVAMILIPGTLFCTDLTAVLRYLMFPTAILVAVVTIGIAVGFHLYHPGKGNPGVWKEPVFPVAAAQSLVFIREKRA